MVHLRLIPHPDTSSPVDRIDVTLGWNAPAVLRLSYRISGALDRVAVPSARSPARTGELWKHTCFEAFVATADGYYEFNLSPSGQWAAYRFDAYRTGMRDAVMPEPQIQWDSQGTLSATIQLPADATGALGLSAVIEDTDGIKAYWALAFPAGPPDFHHAACFAASLPPAS